MTKGRALVTESRAPWLLGLACLLAFGLSLQGDFVWDDNVLIRDNAFAHDWKFLGKNLREDFWSISDPLVASNSGFYRPVVKAAFLTQWILFGGNPVGFRVVNLLLHFACALLVWRWLKLRLASDDGQHASMPQAAFLGAALFALHSSRAETVSWISGSTDLWLALWSLLGLNLLHARRLPFRLLAGPCLALAVFSKEGAVMIPLALALDALLLGRDNKERLAALGRTLVPTACVVAAFAARQMLVPLRYNAVSADGLSGVLTRVGATVGLYARFLVGRSSVLEGAVPSLSDGSFVLPTSWLVLGFAVVGASLLLLGFTISNERWRPYWADFAWFVVLLAPVLNVVPLKYKMLGSDRFLYLPLIGLCALVARAAVKEADPRRLRVAYGVVFLFAALTFSHSLSFVSDAQLWSQELSRHPEEPYAADMLARTLWQDGDPQAALGHAKTALTNTQVPDDQAKLGLLYAAIRADTLGEAEEGQLLGLRTFYDSWADEASPVLLSLDGKTLKLAPNPRTRTKVAQSVSFRTQRAILHARTHDYAHAEQLFASLTHDFPDRESGWVNWVRVLLNQGKREQAAQVLAQATARFAPSPAFSAMQAELNSSPR